MALPPASSFEEYFNTVPTPYPTDGAVFQGFATGAGAPAPADVLATIESPQYLLPLMLANEMTSLPQLVFAPFSEPTLLGLLAANGDRKAFAGNFSVDRVMPSLVSLTGENFRQVPHTVPPPPPPPIAQIMADVGAVGAGTLLLGPPAAGVVTDAVTV